jgi:hypothetical protein
MVTGAVAGNISPEATSPSGNIFTEAMRGKYGSGEAGCWRVQKIA